MLGECFFFWETYQYILIPPGPDQKSNWQYIEKWQYVFSLLWPLLKRMLRVTGGVLTVITVFDYVVTSRCRLIRTRYVVWGQ